MLTALEKKQKMEQERLEKIRLIEEEKRRRMEQALLRKQKEEDEKKKRQEENKHKMVEKQKHAKDIEQNRIQKILEVSERPFIPFFLLLNRVCSHSHSNRKLAILSFQCSAIRGRALLRPSLPLPNRKIRPRRGHRAPLLPARFRGHQLPRFNLQPPCRRPASDKSSLLLRSHEVNPL